MCVGGGGGQQASPPPLLSFLGGWGVAKEGCYMCVHVNMPRLTITRTTHTQVGGGGRLGLNHARICVCPKVKDMGSFLASSE